MTPECIADPSLDPSRVFTASFGTRGGKRSDPISPSAINIFTGRVVDSIHLDDLIFGGGWRWRQARFSSEQ